MLSGNTSSIFPSKRKSAVSTDRRLVPRCQSLFWIASGTVFKIGLLWVASLGPLGLMWLRVTKRALLLPSTDDLPE